MNDRYLFKAKRIDNGEWVQGYLFDNGFSGNTRYFVGGLVIKNYTGNACDKWEVEATDFCEVDPSTICQCTSLKDKNGTLIWENDILMCNNNPKDLVKATFGEFAVIDVDSLEEIEGVIGWHYEVIPTDEISKCKPFCLPMPLTDFYINRCNMKVVGSIVDNPELLEVK